MSRPPIPKDAVLAPPFSTLSISAKGKEDPIIISLYAMFYKILGSRSTEDILAPSEGPEDPTEKPPYEAGRDLWDIRFKIRDKREDLDEEKCTWEFFLLLAREIPYMDDQPCFCDAGAKQQVCRCREKNKLYNDKREILWKVLKSFHPYDGLQNAAQRIRDGNRLKIHTLTIVVTNTRQACTPSFISILSIRISRPL